MDGRGWPRVGGVLGLALGLFVRVAAANAPAAGFTSIDQRLPNPDRPYEMTSGTVNFSEPPFFGLYDLEFAPRDPAQLDVPLRTPADTWEFDSTFDISYKAMVSFGLGPVHQVSGIGKAHMKGVAPQGQYFEPQVYETELSALDLYGLSPIPEVYFRESPTLASSGLIIREDLCPACAAPFTYWRIASFIDVFGEFSYDGGNTWTPGDRSFRIEQAPGPELTGDYNQDGRVNGADYAVLRKGLGTTYSQVDVILWRANFGNAKDHASGVTAATVPEPAGLVLLLLTAAGMSLGRRSKGLLVSKLVRA